MLADERFPRSAAYDSEWVFANQMGPNALWLTESLCQRMTLKPGMRVLDMGCGRAMSSIFLAKEFGVQVWANDLWVSAKENQERIDEAGVADLVTPVRAEAHSLLYDREFFDAAISVDSYQYYGTSDMYLGYFAGFLKPRAQLAIASPGLTRDFEGDLPDYLTEKSERGNSFWDPKECWCFHTAAWWRNHWEHTGIVDIEHAAAMDDGWNVWLKFDEATVAAGVPMPFLGHPDTDTGDALKADRGDYIGLLEIVARIKEDVTLRPRH